jgi:hypothetical protein
MMIVPRRREGAPGAWLHRHEEGHGRAIRVGPGAAEASPFSGAFRGKRASILKCCSGIGLPGASIAGGFVWPRMYDPRGAVTLSPAQLAMLIEDIDWRSLEIERLQSIIKQLQRAQFGRRSERLDPDQLALGLEDLDSDIGRAEAGSLQGAVEIADKRPRR